jgi:hypothetical protein
MIMVRAHPSRRRVVSSTIRTARIPKTILGVFMIPKVNKIFG